MNRRGGWRPILTHELLAAIRRISKEFGTTVHARRAERSEGPVHGDRGYVIERGCMVMEGKGQELLGTKELKVAYLGL